MRIEMIIKYIISVNICNNYIYNIKIINLESLY